MSDDQSRMTPRDGDLVEREWTDQDGNAHYNATIVIPGRMVVSQTVTKSPHRGWPPERQEAAANVRREAIKHGWQS